MEKRYHNWLDPTAIWGTDDNMFAVGDAGKILHYNGANWSSMDSNTTEWLRDVHGCDGNSVYAVGLGGAFLKYDGSVWSNEGSFTIYEHFYGVWCDTDGIYLYSYYNDGVKARTYIRLMSSDLTTADIKLETAPSIRCVWAGPGPEVFVGGNRQVFEFEGASWSAAYKYATFNDMWGVSDTDVYAVGSSLRKGFYGTLN